MRKTAARSGPRGPIAVSVLMTGRTGARKARLAPGARAASAKFDGRPIGREVVRTIGTAGLPVAAPVVAATAPAPTTAPAPATVPTPALAPFATTGRTPGANTGATAGRTRPVVPVITGLTPPATDGDAAIAVPGLPTTATPLGLTGATGGRTKVVADAARTAASDGLPTGRMPPGEYTGVVAAAPATAPAAPATPAAPGERAGATRRGRRLWLVAVETRMGVATLPAGSAEPAADRRLLPCMTCGRPSPRCGLNSSSSLSSSLSSSSSSSESSLSSSYSESSSSLPLSSSSSSSSLSVSSSVSASAPLRLLAPALVRVRVATALAPRLVPAEAAAPFFFPFSAFCRLAAAAASARVLLAPASALPDRVARVAPAAVAVSGLAEAAAADRERDSRRALQQKDLNGYDGFRQRRLRF
eukprot:m.137702 g.137702  ORF g.137702 m.137702 type:complete len:416 (+) comp16609_c2_seq2:1059-2306(+)